MIQYISYQQHQVAYKTIGNGSKLIIAFHGVQQNCDAFLFFKDTLPHFTIIALDLPFHGHTSWQAIELTNQDIVGIVAALMQKYECNKVHLVAYSIGAKCSSVLLQEQPNWIQSVVMIAPDGITENFWYKIATRSAWGKSLFRMAMNNPAFLHRIIDCAASLRLIRPAYAKFYKNAVDSPLQARQLYNIWQGFSFLKTAPSKMIQNIKEHSIPVLLLIGKYDKIIPEKRILPLVKNITDIEYVVVPKGHGLLHEAILPYLHKHFSNA